MKDRKRNKSGPPADGPDAPDEDELRLVPLDEFAPAEIEAAEVDAVEAIELVSADEDPFAAPIDDSAPELADFGAGLPAFEAIAVEKLNEDPVEIRQAAVADVVAMPATVVSTPIDVESTSDEPPVDRDEFLAAAARRKFLLTAAPSWLISLLVHVGLILILAAITLDPLEKVISIIQASKGEVEPVLEQFDIQGPTLESSASDSEDDPLTIPTPKVSESIQVPVITSPMLPEIETSVDALEMNSITEGVMPSSLLTSTLAQMSTALNSRSTAAKSEMLERYGGNASSEKAVAMGLKWLADHQAPDGGWSFAHNSICRDRNCKDAGDFVNSRNAATAVALLPFLGAGQTHLEGQYKQTVKRGLIFLINRLKVTPTQTLPRGSWHEKPNGMYGHALAAILVCEAYAMTRDPDLIQPAQLSLNYLIYAQSERDGGWRYDPGQPGDTSVVGWCLMALKSGKMGNLAVPTATFKNTDRFLDLVSTNKGAFYGYTRPSAKIDDRIALHAVGLLCRMYLGYPKEHPGIQQGVKFLSEKGPRLNDIYYTYYATQVMRHHGGEVWEKWNTAMRDDLVKKQETSGHLAGSWWLSGPHSRQGGRLYHTAMCTMILEVYYRHMPLYSEKSSDDDFEI